MTGCTDIRVPVLLGPMAAGKSSVALTVCERLGLQIVSCDSRQIYRFMDIGTAKPTAADRRRVRHWMIDIADPDEKFSAFEFRRLADGIIRQSAARGTGVLICGGTGLYFKALCSGLGPQVPENPALRARYADMAQAHGRESVFRELAEKDPLTAASSHAANLQRNVRALEVFEATGLFRSSSSLRRLPPASFLAFSFSCRTAKRCTDASTAVSTQ